MVNQGFFTNAADCGRPLNVVGEHISVLTSGATTGSYEVFLQEGPEGSGPIPHTHPWDESFYIIRGEVSTSVSIAMRCKRGGGAMLCMTSRLGASRLVTDIDREIAPDKPDVDRLIAIALRHGLTIAE